MLGIFFKMSGAFTIVGIKGMVKNGEFIVFLSLSFLEYLNFVTRFTVFNVFPKMFIGFINIYHA